MATLKAYLKKHRDGALYGVSEQAFAYFIGHLQTDRTEPSVLIAKNAGHMESLKEELSWLFPKLKVDMFPAWDVQPYDRLSADTQIQAQRVATLNAIHEKTVELILTTANALSIKVPPLDKLPQSLTLKVNEEISRDTVVKTLGDCGYLRVGTVMEAGEFSVRGSLLDVYLSTEEEPFRIDFFDDEIESIKTFDTVSQRTQKAVDAIHLKSVSEVILTEERITDFRKNWRAHFPNGTNDPIYKDITEGKKHDTMGHYLPLFYGDDALPSFLDVLPEKTLIIRTPLAEQAFDSRSRAINEAYDARLNLKGEGGFDGEVTETYRPLKRELLYLQKEAWDKKHKDFSWLMLSDFDDGAEHVFKFNLEPLSFSLSDKMEHKNVIDSAMSLINKAKKLKHKILLSALAPSTLVRMERTLEEHGLSTPETVKRYHSFMKSDHPISMAVTPLAWGVYDTEKGVLMITEQDLFGERNNRPIKRKKRKSEDIIAHFNEIEVNSLVVHHDHGIGQFKGLVTMEISGAKQDFLQLEYDGGDRLFVPVVSLDVLSKYGGDAEQTRLDKLGGAAWQARKAKVKKDLLAMAGDLLKVAAEREIRKGYKYKQPDGLYDEFCAGFPYVPTSEQLQAVQDVEGDLYGDGVMDRLVVGDVGFGKTEVAMRSAFIAAMNGKQVAITVPTTLLARQHFENFHKRFKDFPIKVAHLSRLVTGKQKTLTLEGLKTGAVDIVIGTHALLGKAIQFKDLGLLVVDEEQRFGVAHKERLKQLKADVDVLTLTATPIPRTLQMSLSGLRTLSMITTPPVDRLAIRSYVMKFDHKVMREAILREIFRNGQVFVVTPRVDGIDKLAETIQNLVPESKVRVAHGQMSKDALDRTMTDFYDGQFNVLVATTIIESGIDVARANTLIVHKADRFGLAQLYQIRGRVGRSKVRAYAYFLLPGKGHLTNDAVKRLQILQRLEGIGAGFTLASYDMDIRGSGNILGKEQSGQVKEVGFELYNKMLHEAVAEIKYKKEHGDGASETHFGESYSPTLNLGLTFLIPELYVKDLNSRMSLYRRLASLDDEHEIQDFSDELVDRFGDLPEEVSKLIQVVKFKNRCKALNIEKLDMGPKGVVITLRNSTFPNPVGLLQFVQKNAGLITVKPDQKIIFHKHVPKGDARMTILDGIVTKLENLLPHEIESAS
jgi:transcription-repair coupling factor (superfamily II helicase)